MSQKEVLINQKLGFAGELADAGFTDKISRAAQEEVPFGQLCVTGSDADKQTKLPAIATDITTANNVLGVSIRDLAREAATGDSSPAKYKSTELASILAEGRIKVKVEGAVTPASDVYVRFQGKSQVQTIIQTLKQRFLTGLKLSLSHLLLISQLLWLTSL
jgi:hypothetical protein